MLKQGWTSDNCLLYEPAIINLITSNNKVFYEEIKLDNSKLGSTQYGLKHYNTEAFKITKTFQITTIIYGAFCSDIKVHAEIWECKVCGSMQQAN